MTPSIFRNGPMLDSVTQNNSMNIAPNFGRIILYHSRPAYNRTIIMALQYSSLCDSSALQ